MSSIQLVSNFIQQGSGSILLGLSSIQLGSNFVQQGSGSILLGLSSIQLGSGLIHLSFSLIQLWSGGYRHYLIKPESINVQYSILSSGFDCWFVVQFWISKLSTTSVVNSTYHGDIETCVYVAMATRHLRLRFCKFCSELYSHRPLAYLFWTTKCRLSFNNSEQESVYAVHACLWLPFDTYVRSMEISWGIKSEWVENSYKWDCSESYMLYMVWICWKIPSLKRLGDLVPSSAWWISFCLSFFLLSFSFLLYSNFLSLSFSFFSLSPSFLLSFLLCWPYGDSNMIPPES